MILLCYGTRPEWIKIKPLLNQLVKNNIEHKTLFTGQHVNLINEHKPDYSLEIKDGLNRLDSVMQSSLNQNVFENVKYVLVHGDTTSALSLAISAFHHGLKIIHLEAGLRTYDFENPYPEEMNRQLIDKIAHLLLCPTNYNLRNLKSEKCLGKMFVVGNTGLDNIDKSNIEYSNKILITLHRRENHDMMEEWFNILNKIAIENVDLEFILPIHPNPNVKKYQNVLTHVKVIEPIDHDSTIDLIKKVKFVISDSGGIQEECSFLRKKVIVCRKETERPEALNVTSFLCDAPSKLEIMFRIINEDYIVSAKKACPFGNGKASEKIIEILKHELLGK